MYRSSPLSGSLPTNVGPSWNNDRLESSANTGRVSVLVSITGGRKKWFSRYFSKQLKKRFADLTW